jgi:uncharacterized Tic20 family protein
MDTTCQEMDSDCSSFVADDAGEIRSEDRFALVIAHGGTCFAWFLAPLVVYFLKRDSSRRVAYEALQALLWSALGSIAAMATCGLAIPVFLVWHVLGAVCALGGRSFKYPLVAEVAHKHVYGW